TLTPAAITPPASQRSCAAKPICSPPASPNSVSRSPPPPKPQKKAWQKPTLVVLVWGRGSAPSRRSEAPRLPEPLAPAGTSTASRSSTSSVCTAPQSTTSTKTTSPAASTKPPNPAGTNHSPTAHTSATATPKSQFSPLPAQSDFLWTVTLPVWNWL